MSTIQRTSLHSSKSKPISTWAMVMAGLALSTATFARVPEMIVSHKTEMVSALDKTIKGKILDDTDQPVPGVSIVLKGTSTGTVSDAEGAFSINVPDAGGTLVFSSVGYLSQEVATGSQSSINVKLVTDSKALTEVVVVGYGSQLKREVTGSVQTVSAADIKDMPVTQVTQKLQGRLAGVQINQATGKPGQGMSVRIRGQVSVSA